MKAVYFILICGLVPACGSARADSLSISFQQSIQSGVPGSTVMFFGTLTNLTNSDLFLNADSLNLVGFDPSAIDDSPFFANTPTGFLGPNASTGNIGLFDIVIPNPFVSGGYTGTFQILGGGTADDQTILDSAAGFTVQVSSASTTVPEPASVILILTALILIVMLMKPIRTSSDG